MTLICMLHSLLYTYIMSSLYPIHEDCEQLNDNSEHSHIFQHVIPYYVFQNYINLHKESLNLFTDLTAKNSKLVAKNTELVHKNTNYLEEEIVVQSRYNWMKGVIIGFICGASFVYWLRRSYI